VLATSVLQQPIQIITNTMTKKSDRLFFLCTGQAVGMDWLTKHPGSHIIGELIHILEEQVTVTALALYEVSVAIASPPATMPPLRMEIVGNARKIKCTCCDNLSKWHMGKAAINNVIRMYVNE
jgi:hypothetical protein